MDNKDIKQSSKPTVKVSTKIVNQPSEKDMIPTEREKRLLQEIFDWQERSSKTYWILGRPLGA